MKRHIIEFITFILFLSIIFTPICCILNYEEKQVSNLYYGKVNIERVFQQYPGTYSFLYKKDGQILNFDISEYRIHSYKVYDDVSIDKQMYIDLVKDKNNNTTINIHIHSVKDIGTEAYRSGKMDIYPQSIE